jgi:hypothetical protein
VAQLEDVYSDLKLNYETLKGLISLASPSVSKPTTCETRREYYGNAAVRDLAHRVRKGVRFINLKKAIRIVK